MSAYSTYFGIDSHARTTTVCAVVAETGETRTRTFRGVSPYGEISAWMSSFPGPRAGFYEAGATGFHPARMLSGGDTLVVPIATSSMPTSPEARSKKNDRRDAERLARLGMAGDLAAVWVPDPSVEGLRDVCHLLEDLEGSLRAARARICALLLRHGLVWDEETPKGRPRKPWGQAHRGWIASVRLPDPASQRALELLVAEEGHASSALEEALGAALGLAAASPLAPVVDALRHLKGCGFRTALAFAAEVGDFSRFTSGRRVTSYFGLAPRDGSSALRVRPGGVSRAGSAMVRSLLVEGAWVHARAVPGARKRGPAGADRAAAEHAARGSRRLTERRRAMLGRGLRPCVANAATAAEMARWLWAVGLMAQRAAQAPAE